MRKCIPRNTKVNKLKVHEENKISDIHLMHATATRSPSAQLDSSFSVYFFQQFLFRETHSKHSGQTESKNRSTKIVYKLVIAHQHMSM